MSKKSTATDLPISRRASKAEADAFKLDPHLVRLMWDEPFFSKILRVITKVRTEAIPTAGVLAKDGDIKMWWNPAFLASLSANEIKGLLKHEAFHLVLEHTTKRKHEPHIVWNYATDLAINGMIPEDELPEGGLIPGKAFKPLTDTQKAFMKPEAIDRYEKVSAAIASFPVGLAAEEYFAKLMADPELKDAIEKGDDTGNGKSLSDALKDGDVKIDEDGNLVDKDGNPVTIVPGTMDDHNGWDEIPEEDREFIKGKVAKALEDAVKECDKTGGWGSVPSECRSRLREMISKEIPWQAVLKKFCGMTRRSNRRSNVKRLNRKYPGIHPGMQKGYTSSIAVYIDQSGSVGSGELEQLFGELRGLAKHTAFTCFHFDCTVDENSEQEWKKGRTPETHRTRSGGTCFREVTRHAVKNKHRFDGYLILTDGYAPDPGPSVLKRGWVITPGGDRQVGEAHRKDFVIPLKAPIA